MVSAQASLRKEAPALIHNDVVLTWGQFDSRVNRFANVVLGMGVGVGGKVALVTENSPSCAAALLGIMRAGACAVPLSGMLDAENVQRMVRDADALLLEPPFEALADRAADDPVRVQVAPACDFNIIYTSGTTGSPKGIVHSQEMRAFQAQRMARLGMGDAPVTLVATPLYSNTTWVTLLPTLAYGGTVVLMDKFLPRTFLELAELWRVTHTMLVPVQYQRILNHPDFDPRKLRFLQGSFSTGAPLAASVKGDLVERWPGQFIELYGLTEGGCTTVLKANEHPGKLDTVGRPALGVEVHILDEGGDPLPAGEVGEIAGRAVSMMTGYYKQPDKTEEIIWRDEQGRTFYRTGDLGFLDDDGFLHLQSRKKDVIISGGLNIYAADLEAVLLSHPDIADAAVIAIPSEEWGETPLALVVTQVGTDLASEALAAWFNRRVSKHQRLSGVEFRPALPRNALGKLCKRKLRAPFWDGPAQEG